MLKLFLILHNLSPAPQEALLLSYGMHQQLVLRTRNPKMVIDLLSDEDNYASNITAQNLPAISSKYLSSVFQKKPGAILVSYEM